MIEFNNIKWKNFLSTGNNYTSVQLDRTSTTLILGSNGAGKSTILDALCFGLFGKAFRKINKPQLVNSINEKDCSIEINFTIGRKKYLVRRGIKPNVFEVWIDGKMLDQDSKIKDSQTYLEDNILKLNYKSFTQTVILGSATFVPFMQLSASDRRDIIEDLLDIKIFTSMNEILKVKQSVLSSSLSENEHDRKLINNNIQLQKKYIEEVAATKTSSIKSIENKISLRDASITENEKIIDSEISNQDNLTSSVEDKDTTQQRQNKLDSLESQLMLNLKKNKKDEKFFSEIDNCPTCKQEINDTHKHSMCSDAKTKVSELELGLQKISIEFKKVNARLNSIADIHEKIRLSGKIISEKQSEIKIMRSNILEFNSEIKELNESDTSTKPLEKELAKQEKNLDKLNSIREELVEKREYQNIASVLLKDSGVKTSIIKYYLPVMNKLINQYLHEMDFYVNFTMDEKFSEVIKSRSRENFSYASFSEGEKMRIDLALLFTWRTIAKMKNSVNTNLLILDEVFDSSLDNTGTDEFLKLLNTLGGNNVFVISHKGEILYDKFRSVIKFGKVKNFSQIVEEK
jgi:DNA repair exonuclease SbcCD ATPase subunit|tara:strand:- start:28807 stop:30525 length:1719 start_codon:yes stop_codon:yes gene_type:complete